MARFRRHYGDGVWRDPTYRTRDGVIPFALFWIYQHAMPAVLATERLQQTRAIAHALAQAFAKASDGMLPLTKDELRAAFLLADDPPRQEG